MLRELEERGVRVISGAQRGVDAVPLLPRLRKDHLIQLLTLLWWTAGAGPTLRMVSRAVRIRVAYRYL